MRRGSYKTTAVVLNTYDFGESDRILTLYTEDYGKLRGIAKGARRSRKRFVGNLDPSSHIRVGFFSNGRSDLVRVENASLIEGFNSLRADLERFTDSCYMLELTDEMTREGQALPRVYELLSRFLGLLESAPAATPAPPASFAGSSRAVVRFFEIKLLTLLGYMPELKGCVACGGLFHPGSAPARPASSGGAVYFSSERGGLVCGECSVGKPRLVPVSQGTAGLLSMAARLAPEKLARLRPAPAHISESETLLEDFIKHQLGKELKTRRFMEKLRRAAH